MSTAWLTACTALSLLAALGVGGCSASARSDSTGATIRQTITTTTTLPAPTPTPTGQLAQPGVVVERAGTCPYLSLSTAQADNGSLLGRQSVVTTTPPGCRFYARNAAGYGQKGKAGRISVEIATARYRTRIDAEQGMVRTALAGTDVNPTTVHGHRGAQFRTRFSPADGNRDWACTFFVDKLVVTVKTDRTDLSINALELAKTIAPKFG